jgi:hypothetical protein
VDREYDGLDNVITHADEIKGKAARRCASTSAT